VASPTLSGRPSNGRAAARQFFSQLEIRCSPAARGPFQRAGRVQGAKSGECVGKVEGFWI